MTLHTRTSALSSCFLRLLSLRSIVIIDPFFIPGLFRNQAMNQQATACLLYRALRNWSVLTGCATHSRMVLSKSSGTPRQAKTLQLRRPKPPPPRRFLALSLPLLSVVVLSAVAVSVLFSELLKTLRILLQTFGRITSFGLSIIGRNASNKM
jgi:hypothetical protein